MAAMIEFVLPNPPSWNELYRFGQKRMYKTSAYGAWMQRAVAWGIAQNVEAVSGFVGIEYTVPVNRRRDLDNYLKALNDSLEVIGVLKNDNKIRRLSINEAIRDDVLVKVTPLEPGGSGDKHEKNVWKPTVKKGKARGRKSGSVVA